MDNTYNIDFIARCIAGHNKTAIKSITTELENVQKQVGGVSLVEITQEDFDALTDKDPSTIYLVSNGDKITLYIGGTEVNVQSDWTQTTTTPCWQKVWWTESVFPKENSHISQQARISMRWLCLSPTTPLVSALF